MRVGSRHVSVLLLGVVLSTGCGGAERSERGAITTGGDASTFKLRAGDCFNDPEGFAESKGPAEAETVVAVPCTKSHDNEVLALVRHPGSDDARFPGAKTIEAFWTEKCGERFEGYVGRTLEDSRFSLGALFPTKDSWGLKDDRTSACILYQEGTKINGSKKGTRK